MFTTKLLFLNVSFFFSNWIFSLAKRIKSVKPCDLHFCLCSSVELVKLVWNSEKGYCSILTNIGHPNLSRSLLHKFASLGKSQVRMILQHLIHRKIFTINAGNGHSVFSRTWMNRCSSLWHIANPIAIRGHI